MTWQMPAMKNGIIQHYTVYYRNLNITNSTEMNNKTQGNVLSFLILQLHPFTVYAVQVTATTGAGEGNRSVVTQEQTDESGLGTV